MVRYVENVNSYASNHVQVDEIGPNFAEMFENVRSQPRPCP